MWWFLNKHSQQSDAGKADADTLGQPSNTKRLHEEHLLSLTPDLSQRLLPTDAAIKIWLPMTVANTVKWFADYEGVSQSNWLRQLLIEYAYGKVAAFGQNLRDQRRVDSGIRLSRKPVDRSRGRWVYLVPQLGKNAVAFKLWVSCQMRDDLQALASHAQVGLSPFVREAIIGSLLGRGSLPERPQLFDPPGPCAAAWESDETIPMEEVQEDEYAGLGSVGREWRENTASQDQ